MGCDLTLNNTGQRCQEYYGSNNGLLFAKTRLEHATVAAAKLKATYDAAIKAGTLFPVISTTYVTANNENVNVDNTFTGSILLYQKGGKDIFKIPNPNDWDNYNLLIGQNSNASLYVWRTYELNAISGIYDSTRTKMQMEKVTVKKYWEKATATTPKYLCLEVESMEATRADMNSCTVVPTDFTTNDLTGILDVVLTDAGSVVGSIKVSVADKATGNLDIIDLINGDILVYDSTGTLVTFTAMTLSGKVYTMANASIVTGTYTVIVDTPANTDKLYQQYGGATTITVGS